jgi:hypothetical protein
MPYGKDTTSAIRQWIAEVRDPWPRSYALVSCTVGDSELRRLATELGENWHVVQPGDVLRPTQPPCRSSTDVANFSRGRARLAAWHPSDRELLEDRPATNDLGHYYLRTRIQLSSRRLPPLRSLPKADFDIGGYAGGGFDVSTIRPDIILSVDWPSGWTTLEAAVHDRGLVCRPSVPGRAAVALLHRLGSLQAIRPLLSPSVLEVLYRLGERRGITWFRRKLREITTALSKEDAASESAILRIEAELSTLNVRPMDDEQVLLSFTEVARLVGRNGAREWLEWAEDRGLLVRGVPVVCGQCGARSWRAVGELAPPLVCRGCGQPIRRPFPADQLSFQYRASEALLHALASDALPHLLVLRWVCQVFEEEEGSYQTSELYGCYPGVEILEPDSATVVGRAPAFSRFVAIVQSSHMTHEREATLSARSRSRSVESTEPDI